jgi:hypothetical protein
MIAPDPCFNSAGDWNTGNLLDLTKKIEARDVYGIDAKARIDPNPWAE